VGCDIIFVYAHVAVCSLGSAVHMQPKWWYSVLFDWYYKQNYIECVLGLASSTDSSGNICATANCTRQKCWA